MQLRLDGAAPFYTYPHHLAVADCLQFGDADLDPRSVKVLEDDLCDVLGQCFHQREVPFAQYILDVLRHLGIIQRVVDVVAIAGAAVGQRDLKVELQGLRHVLLAFVNADQCRDLEFAYKDNVHVFSLFGG